MKSSWARKRSISAILYTHICTYYLQSFRAVHRLRQFVAQPRQFRVIRNCFRRITNAASTVAAPTLSNTSFCTVSLGFRAEIDPVASVSGSFARSRRSKKASLHPPLRGKRFDWWKNSACPRGSISRSLRSPAVLLSFSRFSGRNLYRSHNFRRSARRPRRRNRYFPADRVIRISQCERCCKRTNVSAAGLSADKCFGFIVKLKRAQ